MVLVARNKTSAQWPPSGFFFASITTCWPLDVFFIHFILLHVLFVLKCNFYLFIQLKCCPKQALLHLHFGKHVEIVIEQISLHLQLVMFICNVCHLKSMFKNQVFFTGGHLCVKRPFLGGILDNCPTYFINLLLFNFLIYTY